MKKIIVFDADRTLVDSFKTDLRSFREAIENTLKIKLTKDELYRLTTWPTKEFIESLHLTDDEINSIREEWMRIYVKYKTECFPNMIKLIKELYKRGYSINIITSRNRDEFNELNNALKDIIDLFSVIVTSDLVDSPKPMPDSMNYLCNKLKCNSKDVIYVGDSVIDKDFSINSKCRFIPACWENKSLVDEENACLDPINILELL